VCVCVCVCVCRRCVCVHARVARMCRRRKWVCGGWAHPVYACKDVWSVHTCNLLTQACGERAGVLRGTLVEQMARCGALGRVPRDLHCSKGDGSLNVYIRAPTA